MKSHTTISKRLSRKVLIVAMLTFLNALIVVTVISLSSLTRDARKYATKSLDSTISDVETVLSGVESTVTSLSWIVQRLQYDDANLMAIISKVVGNDSSLVACGIGFEPYANADDSYYHMLISYKDGDGMVRQRRLGDENYDYHTLDWYQIPKLLGKPYWSEPMYDTAGSTKMVTTYNCPLYDEDGDFFGVFRADVELSWLTDIVASSKPYESSFTLLIGRNGTYISHPDKSKIMAETLFSESMAAGDEKGVLVGERMISGERGFEYFAKFKGGAFVSFGPLRNGWSITTVSPFNDVYEESNKIQLALICVAILGLLVLFFFCNRVIRRTTIPITEFTYSAMNMSRGVFDASIPDVDTNDEIKQLHDSLYYLQRSINRYISELKTTTASNERFESELNIASAIQANMLVHDFPENGDMEIYASLSPAKEVGGDLYDFCINGDHLYFVVGDVSGKGVPAALFMAITKAAFRFVSGLGLSMAGMVSKINDAFSEGNQTGMFVTLFIGRINLETGEMEYCNAGHNPIVIVSPDGKADYLHAKVNIAAGLFPGFPYQDERLVLDQGSRIILYTDGITEAEDPEKAQYGEDRLIAYSGNLPAGATSEEVVGGLLSEVHEFVRGNDQNDDITVLTIKLRKS